uniref:TSA: Wollemia nobilis Ref_Wollemi_Transcript_15958_1944 transcribed RNA sequence n=1 Tax=Wollemia nobilis TaxID=56998 RepID=A0A0C9S311_9CONI
MSTAAVTANASVNTMPSGQPPSRQSVRKRTTAGIVTRASNRDVVVEEEASISQTAEYGYGKDLSHTIRGETVLDPIPTSKIAPNLAKKTLKSPRAQNPSSPNNPGIPSPKSPKGGSKWQLVGGVFTRAFMVFILVAGLGTTLWNWSLKNPSGVVVPHEVSEGRIAELEKFLKKTTKMMQVQLELVDMKVGKQVEYLRKELEQKIEEQTNTFLNELRNLNAHTGEIEDSLLKLTDTGILSRDEVLGLVNAVVDTRAVDGKGEALSLDDVRAVAKRIVEAEIEKHEADGLGRVDYALGAGGGKVVRHSEAYLVGNGRNWGVESLNLLKRSVGSVHPYASKVLEPSFGEPGHCLPLKSNNVFIDIALRTSILPEAVTLEHVAKSVAYDRSSAPKDFRIFGWLSEYKEDVNVDSEQMFLLGEFSYDLEKSSAQTFNLPAESTGKLINMIKLNVLSNHGSSSHTCIYRMRVHGSEPKSSVQIANEA